MLRNIFKMAEGKIALNKRIIFSHFYGIYEFVFDMDALTPIFCIFAEWCIVAYLKRARLWNSASLRIMCSTPY